MEILKLLSRDHREIERLFAKLEKTTERGTKIREKLFLELKNLLDAHSKSEETVLYDALREVGDHLAEERALEGYEEHHVAKILLKELTALDKSHERWGAKLSVLKELLSHHIEEEEGEIFRSARKAFSRDQLLEMGDQFNQLKAAHFSKIGLPFRLVAKAARRLAG